MWFKLYNQFKALYQWFLGKDFAFDIIGGFLFFICHLSVVLRRALTKENF